MALFFDNKEFSSFHFTTYQRFVADQSAIIPSSGGQFCTGVVDEIDHRIISDFNPPSTIDRNSL